MTTAVSDTMRIIAQITPSEQFRLALRGWPQPSPALTDDVVSEAQRLADLIDNEPKCSVHETRKWLVTLNTAVASPLDETDMKLRCAAVHLVLEDYPAWVLSRDNLKKAMTKFKFFPSVEELMSQIFSPGYDALRSDVRRDARRILLMAKQGA